MWVFLRHIINLVTIMQSAIELLKESTQVPQRQTEGSAGYDISSPVEYVVLNDNQFTAIPLGFKLQIPEGFYVQLESRSSLARNHNIEVFRGVVDSDYIGEVTLLIKNNGIAPYTISKNERIAQMIFKKFEVPKLVVVNRILADPNNKRRYGGFGSTGTGFGPVSKRSCQEAPKNVVVSQKIKIIVEDINKKLGGNTGFEYVDGNILDYTQDHKTIIIQQNNCVARIAHADLLSGALAKVLPYADPYMNRKGIRKNMADIGHRPDMGTIDIRKPISSDIPGATVVCCFAQFKMGTVTSTYNLLTPDEDYVARCEGDTEKSRLSALKICLGKVLEEMKQGGQLDSLHYERLVIPTMMGCGKSGGCVDKVIPILTNFGINALNVIKKVIFVHYKRD